VAPMGRPICVEKRRSPTAQKQGRSFQPQAEIRSSRFSIEANGFSSYSPVWRRRLRTPATISGGKKKQARHGWDRRDAVRVKKGRWPSRRRGKTDTKVTVRFNVNRSPKRGKTVVIPENLHVRPRIGAPKKPKLTSQKGGKT